MMMWLYVYLGWLLVFGWRLDGCFMRIIWFVVVIACGVAFGFGLFWFLFVLLIVGWFVLLAGGLVIMCLVGVCICVVLWVLCLVVVLCCLIVL